MRLRDSSVFKLCTKLSKYFVIFIFRIGTNFASCIYYFLFLFIFSEKCYFAIENDCNINQEVSFSHWNCRHKQNTFHYPHFYFTFLGSEKMLKDVSLQILKDLFWARKQSKDGSTTFAIVVQFLKIHIQKLIGDEVGSCLLLGYLPW